MNASGAQLLRQFSNSPLDDAPWNVAGLMIDSPVQRFFALPDTGFFQSIEIAMINVNGSVPDNLVRDLEFAVQPLFGTKMRKSFAGLLFDLLWHTHGLDSYVSKNPCHFISFFIKKSSVARINESTEERDGEFLRAYQASL